MFQHFATSIIFPSLTVGGDESRAAATWQQLVAMDPQGATNPWLDFIISFLIKLAIYET